MCGKYSYCQKRTQAEKKKKIKTKKGKRDKKKNTYFLFLMFFFVLSNSFNILPIVISNARIVYIVEMVTEDLL